MKKKSLLFAAIIAFLFSNVPSIASASMETKKWQDASVYYITVDRFNDGDSTNDFNVDVNKPTAYHGGDFQGIINKLDYIKGMGFTAICLTPIFDNAGKDFQGYRVQDFYKPDKHFGTMQTFRKLVIEAHKRNMKVMIDFNANNVAPTHPLIDAAKWWIKKTNIDGYHLLDVNYVPASFWTNFSREIKNEKKDFYLLGNIQSTDPDIVSKYKDTGIDAFDNSPLNQELRTGFAMTDRPLTALFSNLKTNNQNDINLMGNYMDNPFSSRFTKDIVENKQYPGARWEMALTYLYTSPGIPVIYYGTEIALNGGNPPDNQQSMNFRATQDLIDYITQLGQLRQELPSLTRGTMKMLYEKNGMLVFKREYKNETAVIAINNTKKSQQVTLTSNQLQDGKELRGLLNGGLSRSTNKQYKIILDRDNAEIYVLAEMSGINYSFIGAIAVIFVLFFTFLYFILKRRNRFES